MKMGDVSGRHILVPPASGRAGCRNLWAGFRGPWDAAGQTRRSVAQVGGVICVKGAELALAEPGGYSVTQGMEEGDTVI